MTADARALPLLVPDWPAPPGVRACFTTRAGGVSAPPWDSLNLALHVGDAAAAVHANRARLQAVLGAATTPCWLEQVHGVEVVRLSAPGDGAVGDAAITRTPGLACVVMVADCVPILLCARDGGEVAAVHAGWRGLAAGIIARAVADFAAPPAALLAWIGPCIGSARYAVDTDLARRFQAVDAGSAACCVRRDGQWHLDLHGLARHQLAQAGVGAVHGAPRCVHAEPATFYSYRRDGARTGRMAALVWRAPG